MLCGCHIVVLPKSVHSPARRVLHRPGLERKTLSRSPSNILDARFFGPHDLDHARVMDHHFHRAETNAVDGIEDGLVTLAALITRFQVMRAIA